jgi:two-component system cell cycle sensor histidine kinase PleC
MIFLSMTAFEPPPPDHALQAPAVNEAVSAALEAWPGVALLIDPVGARLLAANASGRALFPWLLAGQSFTLDSAMPAVRILRDVTRNGGELRDPVPLVLWTALGIRTLSCRLSWLAGAQGEDMVLVKAMANSANLTAAPVAPAFEGALRSDADILWLIAQRIRDGQKQLRAAATSRNAAGGADADTVSTPNEAPRGIDLAKLAHELKTPVSAIAVASEIMKEGRFGAIENERYAGYITDIYASAQHALALIDRMLSRGADSSLMRADDFKFERIVLDDLAEACLSTIQPLAAAKGLDLKSRRAETPAVVTCDATALKQIVLNLISNAIKFTPTGGTITVSTVGGRRGAAALIVEDTGAGMSAADIAAAMRPAPIDIPNVRDGGGLGLGLPLSRALAELIGAELTIDAAPKMGTRVTVTFHGRSLVVI